MVVADTGPGIAADPVERIFDPFFTTKQKGLGLGLAISRNIARAHGGELSAERGRGKGAIFRLELPAMQPTDGPSAGTKAPERGEPRLCGTADRPGLD